MGCARLRSNRVLRMLEEPEEQTTAEGTAFATTLSRWTVLVNEAPEFL